jgi:hypothetical protein
MPSSAEPEQSAVANPSTSVAPGALSDRDRRILDFEREWWHHAGAKEEAIREVFSLSPARYYQLLNAVIDSAGAVRHDPMLIRRLQRAREARTEARATRALASSRPPQRMVRPSHDETTG